VLLTPAHCYAELVYCRRSGTSVDVLERPASAGRRAADVTATIEFAKVLKGQILKLQTQNNYHLLCISINQLIDLRPIDIKYS